MPSTLIARDRRAESREGEAERRRSPRVRVLIGGKLVYGAGFTMDCTIRDLSEEGARITLPAGQAAPDGCRFIVVREALGFEARVAWTAYPTVGLSLTERCDFRGEPPAAMRPLRRLWSALTA